MTIFQGPCQVTEVQTQVVSVPLVETLPETWPTFLTAAAAGRSVAQVPPLTATSTLAVWQGHQQGEAVVMDSSSSPDNQWPTTLR